VKTQQVTRNRVGDVGTDRDIELASYLADDVGPVPLVVYLRIVHDRFGSRWDYHWPIINKTHKIRQCHTDYNNRPSNTRLSWSLPEPTREPSGSGTPSECLVCVSCPMGCRFDRQKHVWDMVKSFVRVRGGGRRSTCSWGFCLWWLMILLQPNKKRGTGIRLNSLEYIVYKRR
jgi:hypothetical protein